jgi:hypothetical protein
MSVLQSKLFLFLYETSNLDESRVIPQVKATKLATLPYPKRESKDPLNIKIQDRCKVMLDLNVQLSEVRTPQERIAIQRQIEFTDSQIDQFVYELYGLTENEIKIVESKKEDPR